MKVCLYCNKYVPFSRPTAHIECFKVHFLYRQDTAPCKAVEWCLALRDAINERTAVSVVWTVAMVSGCYGQQRRPHLIYRVLVPCRNAEGISSSV
jgi:hypothetical protein